MQSLPPHSHLSVTKDFALLEFNTPHGDLERGRTLFEGLLGTFPKRLDLWNILLDAEIRLGEKELVRALFERVTTGGPKLKSKKAKFFFKKWLDYENKAGDEKSRDRVKAKAAEYVRLQTLDSKGGEDL